MFSHEGTKVTKAWFENRGCSRKGAEALLGFFEVFWIGVVTVLGWRASILAVHLEAWRGRHTPPFLEKKNPVKKHFLCARQNTKRIFL